jgi:hypothetical protein
MSQNLNEYLKDNGWTRSSAVYTKKYSTYFEMIELGDMGDCMWIKHFLNTDPAKRAFFSYPENLIEFLKEKAND